MKKKKKSEYTVYQIVIDGTVRYIGRTNNIKRRTSDHNRMLDNGTSKQLYDFLRSIGHLSYVTNLVCGIEDVKENLIKEAQLIIKAKKQINFTEEERNEIEILDAYYKEAKKYYPKKNKISF
jgi:hypothetical protein